MLSSFLSFDFEAIISFALKTDFIWVSIRLLQTFGEERVFAWHYSTKIPKILTLQYICEEHQNEEDELMKSIAYIVVIDATPMEKNTRNKFDIPSLRWVKIDKWFFNYMFYNYVFVIELIDTWPWVLSCDA